MEAGSIDPNNPMPGISSEEVEQAIRLVPEIAKRAERLENVVVGVELPDGRREGGLLERITSVEQFTKGLFFTVLGANVFGGVIAATLFLLIE